MSACGRSTREPSSGASPPAMSSDARVGDERRLDPLAADRVGRHGADRGHAHPWREAAVQAVPQRRDRVHARENQPVVALQTGDRLLEGAPVLGGPDLDERHDRHLGAEPLELLRERLRLGAGDDDAPSRERLVSHGSPPVCGLRPLRARASPAASRCPPAHPRRRPRRRRRPSGEATSTSRRTCRQPVRLGECTDRGRAPGAELPQERALRGRRRPGLGIVDLGDEAEHGVVRAALHRERSLAGSRKHPSDRQPLGHLLLEPEPAHARGGQQRPRRTRRPAPCGCACRRSRESSAPRAAATAASPAPPDAGCSSRARSPRRARRAEGPRATRHSLERPHERTLLRSRAPAHPPSGDP